MRVGPQRFGAGRRASGIGGRHLPDQQEWLVGYDSAAQLGKRSGQLLDRVGYMDRAGRVRRLDRPWNGTAERVIDFDRCGIPAEGAHPSDGSRWQVVWSDQ